MSASKARGRATTVPKWRRVLDDLEARLESGEYTDRFPTDRELVETYGVSRQTVREAVQHLQRRGVIQRQRGRGSVVSGTEFRQPLGTLTSLFRAVEDTGVEQHSDVLSIGMRVDAAAAARLGRPATEELFHLERIRHAGGEPLALDTVWLPASLGEALVSVDFSRTSLYDQLQAHAGLVPDRGEETISPIVPDGQLRASLQMATDEGALRIQRLGWFDGVVVECRLTIVRGSRMSLTSRWPGDGATMPRITLAADNDARAWLDDRKN